MGAPHDNDGGLFRGAVWLLSLGGAEACSWDLDNRGVVTNVDLISLVDAWGRDPGGPPDFDGDGQVGMTDLLVMLANWGACP